MKASTLLRRAYGLGMTQSARFETRVSHWKFQGLCSAIRAVSDEAPYSNENFAAYQRAKQRLRDLYQGGTKGARYMFWWPKADWNGGRPLGLLFAALTLEDEGD